VFRCYLLGFCIAIFLMLNSHSLQRTAYDDNVRMFWKQYPTDPEWKGVNPDDPEAGFILFKEYDDDFFVRMFFL
jgi:hypothetical protein